MKIGAQLYTVRKYTQTAEGFSETIKKVADMGYEYVQVSGIGPIPAETVAKICADSKVKNIITHTNQTRIKDDTDAVIAEHKIMGAEYVGIGSMPAEYQEMDGTDGVRRFIDDYTEAAQKITAAGLKFMYHNHDFEFEKINGKLLFEHLADGFPADIMGFTMDMFWVQAGGADPADWLTRYKGRVDVIHIKDMKMKKRERRMAEVMEGNLNWNAIIKACETAGVKYAMVEQDDCYGADEFECLKRSLLNWNKRNDSIKH